MYDDRRWQWLQRSALFLGQHCRRSLNSPFLPKMLLVGRKASRWASRLPMKKQLVHLPDMDQDRK